MKLQPLKHWAAARYDPPPGPRTLVRWATEGKIQPVPQKHGKTYFVQPDARYVSGSSRLRDRIRRVA